MQNNSPKPRRLIEQRNTPSRSGTLRRRYDYHTQWTVFVPSWSNKKCRAEIAAIDAELMRKANRLRGGYQLITEEGEEEEPEITQEESELEQEAAETEEDSVIM